MQNSEEPALPCAVVVGEAENGRSRISYRKQLSPSDLEGVTSPLLAWDSTPAAPNDGTYPIALSNTGQKLSPEELFPKHSGVRILVSSIASGQSFHMHATPSIDIVFVVSGKVTLITDEEEVKLSQGDVVVQNATRHNWSVSKEDGPCTLAAVVLSSTYGE